MNNPIDFNYPAQLPVTARRDEILAALASNPVVVVCGDTGSGKTTQLPKMALERLLASRPPHSRPPRIACTQPRRLAAVTMAERVAHELNSPLGGLVGYRHRFARKTSPQTQITFLTDGVLLAETRTDPLLRAYDVIIVDEAHERSLNIDFLLGILKRILARRRDLTVIVSSATLDTSRFSSFFSNAPVVSVPGRLFPIEIRHQTPRREDDPDLPREIIAALASVPQSFDTLVFLPGEQDIREAAEALRFSRPADDIIPLLASLPAAEQQRAFTLSPRRRIILATNVAETSVTIPGVRCVIDSGLARISRYVHRTQVQRLQIERVSQASAKQRAGRCGRLGPGICIRLYSEEDFNSRDEFTPPEVLRSSLAGVILSLLDLGMGDVAAFPFIDPPKPAMIHAGMRELLELGAICHGPSGEPALTQTGKTLARIPVEPRLGRIMLAASNRAVLPSAIPLVAALACDDPRRRPIDERDRADQAHAQFRTPGSDFLCTLNLWTWWTSKTASLSQAKSRDLARRTYLSFPKMREWQNLVRQLSSIADAVRISSPNQASIPSSFDPSSKSFLDWSARLHQSLLAGLLSRIGRYNPEDREYRGAHGLKFTIHPGSVLVKKPKSRDTFSPDVINAHRPNKPEKPKSDSPEWILAGELVDTARLFARHAAEIDPAWIEPVAAHLCRYSCHSPHWDKQSGFVRATEQVVLNGIVIIPARRCDLSRRDLPLARKIFIDRAIVDGEFLSPPPPLKQNFELLDALRNLAGKARRPELFDPSRLAEHFDSILPPHVASARDLRKWLESPQNAAAFTLAKSEWWPDESLSNADFPDSITIGGEKMILTYRNTPENPETDGVTCTVTASQAPALRLWRHDWLVPGLLPEKLAIIIASLPSAQRRVLTPIPDTVADLLSWLKPGSAPLLDAVRSAVAEHRGFYIPADAWKNLRIPPHLTVRFRIVSDSDPDETLASSRDLAEALAAAGIPSTPPKPTASPTLATSKPSTSWTFGTIPETTTTAKAGWNLTHYPALHDDGPALGASLRLYTTPSAAAASHATAVTRLAILALQKDHRPSFRTKNLHFTAQLYLKNIGYSEQDLAADIFAGAVREAFVRELPPVRSAEAFASRLSTRLPALNPAQNEIASILSEAYTLAAEIQDSLDSLPLPPATVSSIQSQLAWLLYRGCPRIVPLARLRHYKRYLQGAKMRIARARSNPSGDLDKESRLAPYWQAYLDSATGKSEVKFDMSAMADIRWMIEEYRISLFAQELHTPAPISPKRLDAAFASAVLDEVT